MSAVAWFTEGPVSNPRPSARRRVLTPTEQLCIDGWAIVPLYDPIRPERVVRALLAIAGTNATIGAQDRAAAQLCAFHTRYGDGS